MVVIFLFYSVFRWRLFFSGWKKCFSRALTSSSSSFFNCSTSLKKKYPHKHRKHCQSREVKKNIYRLIYCFRQTFPISGKSIFTRVLKVTTGVLFNNEEPFPHQSNAEKPLSPYCTAFTPVRDNTCFQEVHKVQNSIWFWVLSHWFASWPLLH